MTRSRDTADQINRINSSAANATAITVDSSENVGIGTSAPSFESGAGMEIRYAAGLGAHLKLTDSASGAGGTNGFDLYAFNTSGYIENYEAGSIIFRNGGDQRMAIDPSGNLLLGKTSVDSNTVGVEAKSDGTLTATVAADTVSILNRKTSAGEILRLQKDGSSVGSIGTASGVVQYSGSAKASFGAGDVGLFANPDNDALYPVFQTTLGGRDAAISLGLTSNRFKDLYLSGGVYLGGTGAANKLSDVETGTWTPNFLNCTFSPTNSTGIYTKIGSLVSWSYYSGAVNISNVTNVTVVSGLPFTVRNVEAAYTPFFTAHNTAFGGSATSGVSGYHSRSTTNLYFVTIGTLNTSHIVAGNGKYIMMSGTYFTDA
jgi:hypothetical protein